MKRYIPKENRFCHIRVHIVFCPRNRRRIFSIPGVTEQVKESAKQACETYGVDILNIECAEDVCMMRVRLPAHISVHDCVAAVKSATTKALCANIPDFASQPRIWTSRYYATSEETPDQAEVEAFISQQPKR